MAVSREEKYTPEELTTACAVIRVLKGTARADINEVEAVGPVLAMHAWLELAAGLWVHFVDNTSAECTLVKGASRVPTLNTLTRWVWEQARLRKLHLWVPRVPTKDNPADGLLHRWVPDPPSLPGLCG